MRVVEWLYDTAQLSVILYLCSVIDIQTDERAFSLQVGIDIVATLFHTVKDFGH